MVVDRLAAARRSLFDLAGPAKRQAQAELQRAEAALARGLFDEAVHALDGRITELVAAAKDRDLFGRRRGLTADRSEEHTSELQSRLHLVCRLLLEKKKKK